MAANLRFTQRFSRLLLLAPLVCGLAMAHISAANAQTIPVAVTSCACANAAALLKTATTYITTWFGRTPPGYIGTLSAAPNLGSTGATLVLVSSTSLPISGVFYYGQTPRGGGYAVKVKMGGTDADAIATDIEFLARSAVGTVVHLPSNFRVTNDGETVTPYLSTILQLQGVQPTTLWRGVLPVGSTFKGTFFNTQTQKSFTIYEGDTIRVIDINGWTADFVWHSQSSIYWELKVDSIRDQNGKPVGVPNPTASPATRQPGGNVVFPANATMPPRTVVVYYNNLQGVITVQDVGSAENSANCVGGHCH